MTQQQPRPHQDSTPTPTPEKKRVRTDGALAGSLFGRLSAIDADEHSELAVSPGEIRAKHEARRQKLLDGASEAVRVLVNRMRGAVD